MINDSNPSFVLIDHGHWSINLAHCKSEFISNDNFLEATFEINLLLVATILKLGLVSN